MSATTVGPATPQSTKHWEITNFSVKEWAKSSQRCHRNKSFLLRLCKMCFKQLLVSCANNRKKLPRTFWLSFKEICFHLDNLLHFLPINISAIQFTHSEDHRKKTVK